MKHVKYFNVCDHINQQIALSVMFETINNIVGNFEFSFMLSYEVKKHIDNKKPIKKSEISLNPNINPHQPNKCQF